MRCGIGTSLTGRPLTRGRGCDIMAKRPGVAAAKAGADQGSEGETPSDRWVCPLQGNRLFNFVTGEVLAMDCKRWACVEHGPKLAWRWRQRVSMVPWKLMLTLTLVPEDQATARRAWQRVARWLRSEGMRTYLRVMELGDEHGMRHWHVLVDGPAFVDVRELSVYAEASGLGKVVYASRVKSREGATYYLLGYVFKSLGVENERQRGWRKLTVSRSIPSWEKVLEARHDIPARSAGDHWLVIGGVSGDVSVDTDDPLAHRFMTREEAAKRDV